MRSRKQLANAYRAYVDENSIRDDIMQEAYIELYDRLKYFRPEKGPLWSFVGRFAGQIFAKVVPKVRDTAFGRAPEVEWWAAGGDGLFGGPFDRFSPGDRVDVDDVARSFPIIQREIVFGALNGEPVDESCRRIGISRSTYYRHWEAAVMKLQLLFGRG